MGANRCLPVFAGAGAYNAHINECLVNCMVDFIISFTSVVCLLHGVVYVDKLHFVDLHWITDCRGSRFCNCTVR